MDSDMSKSNELNLSMEVSEQLEDNVDSDSTQNGKNFPVNEELPGTTTSSSELQPCATAIGSLSAKVDTEVLHSPNPDSSSSKVLRDQLLDYLSRNDKAHFKSQQKGDPELSYEEKRKIAEDVLNHSPAQFLGRFGHFIEETHLEYFSEGTDTFQKEAYEINFHLKGLKRFHCKATHSVDVKNRRYDAMKKMIAGGSTYFSEDEMRQRNPYLYEQLVGRFLSEEERKEREVPDIENISFVNLLLTKISRDNTQELRDKQENEENGIEEDEDSSNEVTGESESDKENVTERGTWGETAGDIAIMKAKRKLHKKKRSKNSKTESNPDEVSDEERSLMMQEFVSSMYNSFIDGDDMDFDYSQVDTNPEYDCIDVREKDEEEKYFDADSPEDEEMPAIEDISETNPEPPTFKPREKPSDDDEEDALDAFMKTIKPPTQTSDLTNAFQNLCRQGAIQPAEESRVLKKSHVIKINLSKPS